MKRKFYYTFIAVIIFLTSCTLTTGDIQLSDEYFPLQIGNKWYYETTMGYNHTIEIVDTATINGLLYFVSERKDNLGRSSSSYVRYTDNKIYYKFDDSEDLFFIDFEAPINDPYSARQARLHSIVTRKAYHDKITISGNDFEKVVESYHNVTDLDNYSSYYARGLGIVALIWDREDQEVRLVRAKIDGRTVIR